MLLGLHSHVKPTAKHQEMRLVNKYRPHDLCCFIYADSVLYQLTTARIGTSLYSRPYAKRSRYTNT